MAKSRQIVTVSHIARLYDISRQSVRNWIDRHEDFPKAIVGDGLKLVPHGKGTSGDVFVVSDDSGRTKLYPLDEVKTWVKSNASSLRSQNGVQAAVESGKKAAKPAKAPAKKPAKDKAKPSKKAPAKATKTAAPAKAASGKKKGKKKAKA